MNVLSRNSLAAGLFLAVFGAANVAHAGFEKFFITGNPSDCQAVFDGLLNQQGIVHAAVKSEIRYSPLVNNDPGTVIIGTQTADIFDVVVGDTQFDWVETTSGGFEGFDAVSIKAGNGRTVYVYTPDATAGADLSDLNTTKKITEVLICADEDETIVFGGDLCNITSDLLFDLCAVAGDTSVVEIFVPGEGTSQICGCPGVTLNICNPATVCDVADLGTAACLAANPGGFCDPDNPNDTGTTEAETLCCLISPFTGESLTITSPPTGTFTTPASGSFCSLSTTTSTTSGTLNFSMCF